MEDIYGELDEGIREVVELLRANGVNTFASCEGGEGHAFDMPTVRIDFSNKNHVDEENRIARILNKNGYSGYYIATFWAYGRGNKPNSKESFIQIQFWVSPVVKDSDFPFDKNGG